MPHTGVFRQSAKHSLCRASAAASTTYCQQLPRTVKATNSFDACTPFQSNLIPFQLLSASRSSRTLCRVSMADTSNAGPAGWLNGKDNHGAYIDVGLHIKGADSGPFKGKTFAIKDLFDVAGQRTGFGNPLWLETHPEAHETAPPVTQLLGAGATARGRTHMDELAYSLNGENAHYGTPTNPAAPGHIPGGSSSGSAVAVAAGHVDVALGSDTGGSVRVPASYCGIFGMRPSHGRISLQGARPLAPSFDTVGWFARSFKDLQTTGLVLYEPSSATAAAAGSDGLSRVIWPSDAWATSLPDTQSALKAAISPGFAQGSCKEAAEAVQKLITGSAERCQVVDLGSAAGRAEEDSMQAQGLTKLTDWLDVFRVCQAGEIWAAHGAWITQHKPNFGPGIKERFAMASGITQQEWDTAKVKRDVINAYLNALLGKDGMLVMPTTPGPAPLIGVPAAQQDAWRKALISLTCVAGSAGLPQISIPLAHVNSLPVGLSLIGPVGSDEKLLEAAEKLISKIKPDLL